MPLHGPLKELEARVESLRRTHSAVLGDEGPALLDSLAEIVRHFKDRAGSGGELKAASLPGPNHPANAIDSSRGDYRQPLNDPKGRVFRTTPYIVRGALSGQVDIQQAAGADASPRKSPQPASFISSKPPQLLDFLSPLTSPQVAVPQWKFPRDTSHQELMAWLDDTDDEVSG